MCGAVSVQTLHVSGHDADVGDMYGLLSADEGKEFAHHEVIVEALNADFYCVHPYPSWERDSTNIPTDSLPVRSEKLEFHDYHPAGS
ncbi:MAG: hypothetical protein AB7P17_14090 [Nitrospirales bacterium]|nr:hypothetical protein [Nitrospirales bacterium]